MMLCYTSLAQTESSESNFSTFPIRCISKIYPGLVDKRLPMVISTNSNGEKGKITLRNPNEHYLKNHTAQAIEKYCPDIIRNLRIYDFSSEIDSNYLMIKDLNQATRFRLIDWIVQVVKYFHYTDETFFFTVKLFDRYVSNKNTKIKESDFLLIAICCLFISSKFLEVKPLSIKDCVETLSFKELSE